MATSYKKLWKKMIDLDMKKKDLAEKAQKEANKKAQEQPAVKVFLKARLAEKKVQVAGSGKEHEVQKNILLI